MARGLAKNGHAVRTLTAHPHYPGWRITAGYGQWSRTEEIDGVVVVRLRHYVPPRPSLVLRALSEASFGVRQVFARWGKPTSIVAVSPALISSALARMRALVTHRRTPFVVWVQDLYGLGITETGQGSGRSARMIRAIERWLLRSASAVIVIHERFAARVHADFGVPHERIRVVRNWTHLPPMPPANVASVRVAHGWGPDEIVVVHSGNMGVKQGLHHVVEAARLAHRRGSNVRFVLIGDGSQRGELQALADEQPASIQFIAPLDDLAFADTLQSADILLVNELPGVAEMAVPSKLTSYFAAGRPVLAATDDHGITAQEVREAEAGIVVTAGDPAAILDGALWLAADASRAELFAANGRRYKEDVLDESRAIERFDSLLLDTAATSADKRPA